MAITDTFDLDVWSITPEHRLEAIRAALLEQIEDQSLVVTDDGSELSLVPTGELFSALEAGGWEDRGDFWVEPEYHGEIGDGQEPYTLLCQRSTAVLSTGQGDSRDVLRWIRDADSVPVFSLTAAKRPNGRVWRWAEGRQTLETGAHCLVGVRPGVPLASRGFVPVMRAAIDEEEPKHRRTAASQAARSVGASGRAVERYEKVRPSSAGSSKPGPRREAAQIPRSARFVSSPSGSSLRPTTRTGRGRCLHRSVLPRAAAYGSTP